MKLLVDKKYYGIIMFMCYNSLYGCEIMSNEFAKVLDIVNSLSLKELGYICNGKFIDSPYLIYRKIKNNTFIEVYYYDDKLKDEHHVVGNNILVVTSSKSRRKGNADYLLKLALKECPGNLFVYETAKDNIPSINLAIKNGFILDKEIDNILYFVYRR